MIPHVEAFGVCAPAPWTTDSPIAMTKVESEQRTIRRMYCAGGAIKLVPKNKK